MSGLSGELAGCCRWPTGSGAGSKAMCSLPASLLRSTNAAVAFTQEFAPLRSLPRYLRVLRRFIAAQHVALPRHRRHRSWEISRVRQAAVRGHRQVVEPRDVAHHVRLRIDRYTAHDVAALASSVLAYSTAFLAVCQLEESERCLLLVLLERQPYRKVVNFVGAV